MDLKEAFAEVLFKARSESGLTQEELAHRAGLHHAAISFLERAKRTPNLYTIIAIAWALNLKAGDLISEVEKLGPDIKLNPSFLPSEKKGKA